MFGFWLACLVTLGGVFVNGATDAPVTMSAAVLSGVLSRRTAALVSAVGNFSGLLLSAVFFPSVLHATLALAPFGDGQALVGVTAVLVSAVVFATIAAVFGIPTSESHALMSALAGASVAFGLGGKILPTAVMALVGLGLSVVGGYVVCRIFVRVNAWVRCHVKGGEKKAAHATVLSAAVMSFWHGAQDGQKFAGLFFLLMAAVGEAPSPVLLLAVALVLAAGSAFVGGPILETLVGGEETLADPSAAELSSTVTIAVCTLLGLPVSTTHIKTAALFAAGRRGILGKTALAGLLTLPACFSLAYVAVNILC